MLREGGALLSTAATVDVAMAEEKGLGEKDLEVAVEGAREEGVSVSSVEEDTSMQDGSGPARAIAVDPTSPSPQDDHLPSSDESTSVDVEPSLHLKSQNPLLSPDVQDRPSSNNSPLGTATSVTQPSSVAGEETVEMVVQEDLSFSPLLPRPSSPRPSSGERIDSTSTPTSTAEASSVDVAVSSESVQKDAPLPAIAAEQLPPSFASPTLPDIE
jgi:hypothetical protein